MGEYLASRDEWVSAALAKKEGGYSAAACARAGYAPKEIMEAGFALPDPELHLELMRDVGWNLEMQLIACSLRTERVVKERTWRESRRTVGAGSFGSVVHGLDTATGRALAIKHVKLPDDRDEQRATHRSTILDEVRTAKAVTKTLRDSCWLALACRVVPISHAP